MMVARAAKGCKLIRRDGFIVKDPLIEFCEGGGWHVDVALRSLFYHTPKLLRTLLEHVRKLKLQFRPTLLARLYKCRHRVASLFAGFAKLAFSAAELSSGSSASCIKPRREMLVPLIWVGYLLTGR
jgi:hypothetical protein